MSRKITFLTLFLWLMTVTFPVIAQQKADTTYTFRFVPQKDMFYVPWNGNDTELARLLECIERNRTDILDGRLPLLVDGYCNSLGSETENLATAKIRANRVKSELIIRAEIKEENFITRNHATEGDFVTVRLTALFLSLGFLAVRMVGIRRLRRRSRLTDCGAYTLAEHPQIATPFSFLRTVFLGGGYEGRRRMIVLCHEAGHVRHRHSAERIAVELVRSLFWFNPFVWIAEIGRASCRERV